MKGQLAMKEACGDLKSGCKRTCKEAVADVLYRFPPPRDCIVGEWGSYSSCVKLVVVVVNLLLDQYYIQQSLEENHALLLLNIEHVLKFHV